MKELITIAEKMSTQLVARKQTIAVAESSTGGLFSAALLSVPGASAYFLGGAVAYTRPAKLKFLALEEAALAQCRPATEGHALVLARGARAQFATTWGLSETGATGPTGNRYGDAAGHSCMAIAGLEQAAMTLETGSPDRLANMHVFANTALNFLLENLSR